MDTYVIGLDNGGTVTKAALYTVEGREVCIATRHTKQIIPRPGYTERDMEILWKVNCECIAEILEKSGVAPEAVAGISQSGHGKGLYAWGKDGKPAYNGIISTDNRAWQYPERWESEGVWERLYPQLCQKLIPSQQAALLAWLKDHERDVYDSIQWVFSVKDYIRYRLTGEAFCELTDISGSGLMDVRNACYDRELLEALGIGEVYEKLAPLKSSYDICGRITEEAASLTGLNPGTPVAGGMFDIDACAIAMDITSHDKLCSITGTWSINEFISSEPIIGTAIAMNSLYAIPGVYLLEECSPTSAGNLEWFLENLFADMPVPEGQSLYQYVDRLVEDTDPSECELYYLPFLYGSNAHPLAKGSFIGLNSYHNKAHLLRAVFEGVAFSHKTHIDRLLSVREAPDAIRLAGGVVNSFVWTQIFADVLDFPIETVKNVKELGAMGSAMAATVAAGIYRDYHEAAEHMVTINEPVYPDPERAALFARKYEKYRAISDALDTVWDSFSV